jgi:cyclase|tara:strand:- start:2555 stop:3289 length:735 start_codon:yes stop_codon:yes gene_type:complete
LNKRIIARLDIKGPNLIKGINFEGLRKLGNPNDFAIKYYVEEVDEILFMDNVASLYGRNSLFDVIKKSTEQIFVPITVGGGIRNLSDVEKILKSGADKVAINSAAISNPDLISQISKTFGSQCLVISIEAKKKNDKSWEAYVHNGRDKTGLDVMDWSKKCVDLGAGEIFVTSIDQDGTFKGFDNLLNDKISKNLKIPLVIGGGLGSLENLDLIKTNQNINGLSIGSALHYNKIKIKDIKSYLEK